MDIKLLLAIITGLWYWFAGSIAGYTLFPTLKSPLFIGFILGLLTGDPVKGIQAGAAIEIVYLGIVAPGGNMPSDRALAGLIAIPLVLTTDTSVEIATTIAVPVGILGVFLNNIRRYINTIFSQKADQYANEGNINGIWNMATIWPLAVGLILRFPVVFVANYYGIDLIDSVLEFIPEWIMHGLTVMGGMLPTLGFATTMLMIGKAQYFPLFFIGYFLVKYFSLSTMGAAIFGLSIAFLIMYMGGFSSNSENISDKKKATNKIELTNEDYIKQMMQ